MKRRNLILGLLAVALVLTAAIGPAMAYFTTYTQAKGGYTIHLGDETRINEEFKEGTKTLSIQNTEGQPVFVRAHAWSGSGYPLSYPVSVGWTFVQDAGGAAYEGWWYYNSPLAAGETASPLQVKINNIPAEAELGDNFNVVVVYESTPVQYDENGVAFADWTMTLKPVGQGGQS